jgi:hypothetical protein
MRNDQAYVDTPVELEDVTYAVLTTDGELHFKSTPSRAYVRAEASGFKEVYQPGPFDAAEAAIGGPHPRADRAEIGNGLFAWVSGVSLRRPDAYPVNEIGGRTVDILNEYAGGSGTGAWAGPIVLTAKYTEVRARHRLGDDVHGYIIEPLDHEQKSLICEAYRAALGDIGSLLIYEEDADPDFDESRVRIIHS